MPDAARRTLVLGGARSGKSGYAEGLLPAGEPVRYLATGRRDPADPEWSARIAAHRDRRPPGWRTVELAEAGALATELRRPDPAPVLVDDLGTWLAGLLDDTHAWERDPEAPERVAAAEADLVAAVTDCPARLTLVSAEVGLGVVPATPAGRLFRDELGSLNARLAPVCDAVLLLVAGLPLQLR